MENNRMSDDDEEFNFEYETDLTKIRNELSNA